MTQPNGGFVVTPEQMYTAIQDLRSEITKLGTKMDVYIAHDEETKKDVADHESRIRSLEKSRWPLPSLAAVISVLGVVLALFGKTITF